MKRENPCDREHPYCSHCVARVFKSGASMEEIANLMRCGRLEIEEAIRTCMISGRKV